MKEKSKKPWPTKDAMEQVYEMKLWGGGEEYDFYSGEGSHLSELVNPYIAAVTEFLQSQSKKLTVLDLGCGDFNIGSKLVKHSNEYIATDIVESLIERNRKLFEAENLSFVCLDIAKDHLPDADCVIIRQVLQHLSNKEVKQVLDKLTNYPYIILTEHLPVGEFIPNKDIISGQGIRLKKKSGLVVTEAPFNFCSISQKELLSVELANKKGVIKTIVYEL